MAERAAAPPECSGPDGDPGPRGRAAFVGRRWGQKPTYTSFLTRARDPAPGEHSPAIYSSPQRSVSGARAGDRLGEVERAEAGGEGSRERQQVPHQTSSNTSAFRLGAQTLGTLPCSPHQLGPCDPTPSFSVGPCGSCPTPCPQPEFCLWQNFSQWISLIREVRTSREKKGKQPKEPT